MGNDGRITREAIDGGGKPRIRDLDVTVDDVLARLATGMSEDDILAELPALEAEDIQAARAFAASGHTGASEDSGHAMQWAAAQGIMEQRRAALGRLAESQDRTLAAHAGTFGKLTKKGDADD